MSKQGHVVHKLYGANKRLHLKDGIIVWLISLYMLVK